VIVVGYTADPFGGRALDTGIAEAKLRGRSLLVINPTSGKSLADPGLTLTAHRRFDVMVLTPSTPPAFPPVISPDSAAFHAPSSSVFPVQRVFAEGFESP
jgi:hypothetical protein